MIVPKALSFDPKLVKNKIGDGTSSTVTMGTYSREYVAVKRSKFGTWIKCPPLKCERSSKRRW
jgi:hypothetical protein